MAVTTPPELVARGTNIGVTNVVCGTWIPPFVGPQPCDFLVAFVMANSEPSLDDPVIFDEMGVGSGSWVGQAGVHSRDCANCGCPVSLFCFTKMVQTAQPSGLNICAEFEMDLACMLIEVYRFTGVSKASPVVQVNTTCGCGNDCNVQVSLPDAVQSQAGLISLMGLATNCCRDPQGPEFNGGDDFWNFLDEQQVCLAGEDGFSFLDTQWAEVDMAGGDLPVNAYLGTGFFCVRAAEYAAINIVLAPGACSFTPPATTPAFGHVYYDFPGPVDDPRESYDLRGGAMAELHAGGVVSWDATRTPAAIEDDNLAAMRALGYL